MGLVSKATAKAVFNFFGPAVARSPAAMRKRTSINKIFSDHPRNVERTPLLVYKIGRQSIHQKREVTMYTLSLLIKARSRQERTPPSAFRDTINLARRAEELGYKRFWVAEHHNSPRACRLCTRGACRMGLAKTSRIRVGSVA